MDPNSINIQEVELREQDRWLPIANVARLMKSTLPASAKVSKDAKECMQECVSEFISFVTSEASDRCLREKRKTINGEDILYSMHDLGFENYAEVLKIFLAKYREEQALRQERGETKMTKKQLKAQKAAQEEAAAAAAAAAQAAAGRDERPVEDEELDYESQESDKEEKFITNKRLSATKEDYDYDIGDLAKQLTNEDADIDTLTAEITSSNGHEYF